MEFFIFIVVAIIIVWIIKEYWRGEEKNLPYFKRNYLLSKAESSFFRILEQATENKYYIFPQIRISNLLYVRTKGRSYYRFLNKIKYKSVDFVLTDKDYLNPLLAIELDDSTHNRNDRMERDDFVEHAFYDADFPLLRIEYSLTYDIPKLKARIEELIAGKKDVKKFKDEPSTSPKSPDVHLFPINRLPRLPKF